VSLKAEPSLPRPEGRELIQAMAAAPGPDAGVLLTNIGTPWLARDVLAAKRADMITCAIQGNGDGSTAVDCTVNCATGYPLVTGGGSPQKPVNHVLPAWLTCSSMRFNAQPQAHTVDSGSCRTSVRGRCAGSGARRGCCFGAARSSARRSAVSSRPIASRSASMVSRWLALQADYDLKTLATRDDIARKVSPREAALAWLATVAVEFACPPAPVGPIARTQDR